MLHCQMDELYQRLKSSTAAVSFVENPVGKRGKPAQAASSKADAVDAPATFAKPQPKSKKRTLTQ